MFNIPNVNKMPGQARALRRAKATETTTITNVFSLRNDSYSWTNEQGLWFPGSSNGA